MGEAAPEAAVPLHKRVAAKLGLSYTVYYIQ